MSFNKKNFANISNLDELIIISGNEIYDEFSECGQRIQSGADDYCECGMQYRQRRTGF